MNRDVSASGSAAASDVENGARPFVFGLIYDRLRRRPNSRRRRRGKSLPRAVLPSSAAAPEGEKAITRIILRPPLSGRRPSSANRNEKGSRRRGSNGRNARKPSALLEVWMLLRRSEASRGGSGKRSCNQRKRGRREETSSARRPGQERGKNRWMAPPAALCVFLRGFAVLPDWKPLFLHSSLMQVGFVSVNPARAVLFRARCGL